MENEGSDSWLRELQRRSGGHLNRQSILAVADNVIANVERVIFGKREAVELVLVALLSQGHVLVEDVPGVGKTMLAKTIARSLGCTFRRIQFTPDLLPSDITGVSIFNQRSGDFELRPGPIVAQVVLADEINRAMPRTQSALLECMEERQITIDGVTVLLPRPFIVLATQNPVDFEGTFPLPEAQLDRFLLRINLGYPSPSVEASLLESHQLSHPFDNLGAVISADELVELQREIRQTVHVAPAIREYIVGVVNLTRVHPDVALGASPRAALALLRASQTRAVLQDRDYVLPDDVKALAVPILSHRLIVGPRLPIKRAESASIVDEILETVPIPGTRILARR